jgi:hypothetical protein
MGNGFTKGGRDFLELGTWNVCCAYCGRKRKANELITDDEFARKMWCCPEHADRRHPQEFVRGIPEHMSVPRVQPPIVNFRQLNLGFPLVVRPNVIQLAEMGETPITTEVGSLLTTEGGSDLVTEAGSFQGFAAAVLPSWVAPVDAGDPSQGVFVTSINWTWASGGAGIQILSPNSIATQLFALASPVNGVLEVTIVDSLGGVSTATASVST